MVTLLEVGIRGLAGTTSNIFQDITSQNVFQLLLLEFTPNNQSLASINRSGGTQFGEQKLRHMFIVSLHSLANIRDIRKNSLLISFSEHLRRRDLVASALAVTSQIRMLRA